MKSIIVNDTSICIVCGKPHPQEHHVFEGWANRKISEKYHLTIPLCMEHHVRIHTDKKMMDAYRRLGQEVYEKEIGTREQFIKEFGKNSILED